MRVACADAQRLMAIRNETSNGAKSGQTLSAAKQFQSEAIGIERTLRRLEDRMLTVLGVSRKRAIAMREGRADALFIVIIALAHQVCNHSHRMPPSRPHTDLF